MRSDWTVEELRTELGIAEYVPMTMVKGYELDEAEIPCEDTPRMGDKYQMHSDGTNKYWRPTVNRAEFGFEHASFVVVTGCYSGGSGFDCVRQIYVWSYCNLDELRSTLAYMIGWKTSDKPKADPTPARKVVAAVTTAHAVGKAIGDDSLDMLMESCEDEEHATDFYRFPTAAEEHCSKNGFLAFPTAADELMPFAPAVIASCERGKAAVMRRARELYGNKPKVHEFTDKCAEGDCGLPDCPFRESDPPPLAAPVSCDACRTGCASGNCGNPMCPHRQLP
jgi:hypothetical protein